MKRIKELEKINPLLNKESFFTMFASEDVLKKDERWNNI